ncbi:MFS transporter-like protein [Rhizodiscina lignyota]|uniref:MFS transporter-like protein n=1 Tax=Rhizodiscina lignyota TaxID=1504668 RepID=A0A9P4IG52_9PEZI|nr:MFS transporter-like protein [Rhizodiscina lignyota]
MAYHRSVLSGVWHRPQKRPWLLKYRSSKIFLMVTVSFAVFTDIFLYAVIIPVIPFTLNSRAGITQDRVQFWTSILVACYGAALLAASPICGYLADQLPNRRSSMLFGLVTLTGATALLQVGSNIGLMICGRVLQGVSAAIVWTVGLALLVDTVGQREIGMAMGWVGTSMSIAQLAAPMLGGVVFDKGSYNDVFSMAYTLLGLDIAFRMLMIERKEARRWDDLDSALPPAFTGTRWPTPSPMPPQHPADEKITPPAALRIDIPRYHNLPPLITLLFSRRLLSALWGVMVQAALLASFDSTIPIYVSQIFGWNSTGGGLIFLPLLLPSLLNPWIGTLVDKYGPRWFATSGYLLAAPFLVLLRFIVTNDMVTKVLFCTLLVLIGLSLDLIIGPLMAEISLAVEDKELRNPGMFGEKGAYAQAYGLFNAAFAAGCLVGPIWGGMIKEHAGWGTMTWTLGLLSGVTAVPTMIWCGGSIFKKRRARMRDDIDRADEYQI